MSAKAQHLPEMINLDIYEIDGITLNKTNKSQNAKNFYLNLKSKNFYTVI